MIHAYQQAFGCRLVVMVSDIFSPSITYLEELIYDAHPAQDLHLLLNSPGGDGETAIRIVRSLQRRCRTLTVIVPDQAKSAATLIALGAHRILMGPASDLGPIDPQFQIFDPDGRYELVSGKDLVAAVDDALAKVADKPDTYTLHSALLANVNALMVQSARTALARTADLLREALASNPDRSPVEVDRLHEALTGPLITDPKSHGAPFDVEDATRHGLPVEVCDHRSLQWQLAWRLWTKYAILNQHVYEGENASQLVPLAQMS